MNKNTISLFKSASFYFKFFLIFIILLHIFLLFKNFNFILDSFSIGLPFSDVASGFYDFKNTFLGFSLYLFFINLFLAAINITLLLEYLKLQNNNLNKSSKSKAKLSFALFISYLATHCASCGAALFGGLISISFVSLLPFGGLEFYFLSILILLYLNYDIIKKINNPYVC